MADKQFTRFELTPVATVPGHIGAEIHATNSDYFAYALIPLHVWQDENALIDFVAAMWQEVPHE